MSKTSQFFSNISDNKMLILERLLLNTLVSLAVDKESQDYESCQFIVNKLLSRGIYSVVYLINFKQSINKNILY